MGRPFYICKWRDLHKQPNEIKQFLGKWTSGDCGISWNVLIHWVLIYFKSSDNSVFITLPLVTLWRSTVLTSFIWIRKLFFPRIYHLESGLSCIMGDLIIRLIWESDSEPVIATYNGCGCDCILETLGVLFLGCAGRPKSYQQSVFF